MSCGVGRRHSSDPMLLWLWCRLAAAAPILLLAWEFPYAAGVALKKDKKKINKLVNFKRWEFLLKEFCLLDPVYFSVKLSHMEFSLNRKLGLESQPFANIAQTVKV